MQLIQDSSADYDSQTGAMIVGEPYVGDVVRRGDPLPTLPLSGAREEAEMIR